jgi:hypothetical protein
MELPKDNALEILPHITKPFAGNGLGYPYTSLANNRRLEELAYALYKKEAELGNLPGVDAVSLMSGSSDLGQDCRLIRRGKSVGNIQCKLLGKLLSVDDFGKEIVKFILYSIIDPSLIANPSDFTYYIVAPQGFSRNCDSLITGWNSKISTEAGLDKWIRANLKNSSFKSLDADSVRPDVLRVLSFVRVKSVQGTDLDILLNKEYNSSLPEQFFQVRTMISVEQFEKLSAKVAGKLEPSQIRVELERGSLGLNAEKNEFDGISNSHIVRKETEDLLNWIQAPLRYSEENKAENICLLVGNAGMGKTVILKDLYDQLLAKQISVLGLKADKLYAVSIKELQEKANSAVPLLDLIDQASENSGQLVLIIDQIDALSQSISSDRRFLQTYAEMIQAYKHKLQVRIIVSVRIADLHYDPALRPYRSIKSVMVDKLSRDVVLTQLGKLDILEEGITEALLELLRIPNNLDVFSRIYRKGRSIVGISSLQGLYAELWTLKLEEPKGDLDSARLVQLVNSLAESMHDSHQITISEVPFQNYRRELAYLKSEQLIKIEEGRIQYFHQSFYDYVFSRWFVENGADLSSLIFSRDQSILVRSSIRMILNYLRDYDHELYLKELRTLLSDQEVYFHIKHLIILGLAILENPTQDEQKIVLKTVLGDRDQAILFLRHVTSVVWMDLLITKSILVRHYHGQLLPAVKSKPRAIAWISKLLNGSQDTTLENDTDQDLLTFLLRRHLYPAQGQVLELLLTVRDAKLSENVIYYLQDWSNPKAYEVLEHILEAGDMSRRSFYSLLTNIIPSHSEYVFKIVKESLTMENQDAKDAYDHAERDMLEALFSAIPQIMCDFILERVKDRIKDKVFEKEETEIISDYALHDADLYEDTNRYSGKEYLYQLMGKTLHAEAVAHTNYFRVFLDKHLKCKYKTVIKLVVFTLQSDPAYYACDIFLLMGHLYQTRFICVYTKLNHQVRVLLKNVFGHFSDEQKDQIVKWIRNIIVPDEARVWVDVNGERKIRSYWGYQQFLFLRVLPMNFINASPELRRAYLALSRKHPDITDRYPGVFMASAVGAPLRASAYRSMSFPQWLASFKKYTWSYEHGSGYRSAGGIREHAGEFRRAVKNDPVHFLPLVQKIVDISGIEKDYAASAILGLTDQAEIKIHTRELVEMLIMEPVPSHLHYEYTALAEHQVTSDDYSENIVRFLVEMSLNAPEKDLSWFYEQSQREDMTADRMIERGNHSDRTRAALVLMWVSEKNYEQVVFSTVEQMLKVETMEIRASLINSSHRLYQINPARALALFIQTVTNPENVALLAPAISASQHMVKDNYTELLPYFKLAIDRVVFDTDIDSLTTVLYSNWLHGDPQAEKLFLTFVSRHSAAQIRAIAHAFDHFYFDGLSKGKSLKILFAVLDAVPEKGVSKFEHEFLDMDKIEFQDILGFLKVYAKSGLFRMSDYFLDYLTLQCATHPFECVDLFWSGLTNTQANPDHEGHFRHQEDKAIKFIVGAYNMLDRKDDEKHKSYRHKLMLAFDVVLKDERFWRNAENALEKLIS